LGFPATAVRCESKAPRGYRLVNSGFRQFYQQIRPHLNSHGIVQCDSDCRGAEQKSDGSGKQMILSLDDGMGVRVIKQHNDC